MKNTIKRRIGGISIVILLLFTFILPVFNNNHIIQTAYAFEIQMKENEEYYNRANEASDTYVQIISTFIKENNESLNLYKGDTTDYYIDEYGGMYFDEDGYLNLLTKGVNKEIISTLSNKYSILKIGNVEFSYNELLSVQNFLIPKMKDLGIAEVSLVQRLNKIEVNLFGENKEEVINCLKSNQLYNEKALYFKENYTLKENSKIAQGGTEIWYNYGFLGLIKSRGTICVNAVDNVTGQKGVITNAHVAVADKKMKHAEGELSKRTKGWHSGNIDAAFVPFPNNNWVLTDTSTYDGSVTYGNVRLGTEAHIVEGFPVRKIGRTSGITNGTILSTNTVVMLTYSGESSPTSISNVIKYSNSSLPGDSGGPVYFNGGPKSSLWLIAMNFAGPAEGNPNVYGYGCRISNVITELNITIVTHDNIYNY